MKKYLLRQTDRPLMYESGYGGVKKEKDAFAAFVWMNVKEKRRT